MKNPIKTYELAAKFAALLARDLTPAQLDSISDLNAKEKRASVCHTHDFIDANVTMAEAFAHVMGHEIDLQSNEDGARWDAAWTCYRENYCGHLPRALTSAGFVLEHQGGGMFNWRKNVAEGLEMFCCDSGGCEPTDQDECVFGVTLCASDQLCSQTFNGRDLACTLNYRLEEKTT